MVAGELDTGLIGRVFDALTPPAVSARAFAEAALVRHAAVTVADAAASAVTGPWTRADGWRLGMAAAPSVYDLVAGDASRRVRVWSAPLRIAVDDAEPVTASVRLDATGALTASVVVDGRARSFPLAVEPDAVWLLGDDGAVHVSERAVTADADAAADTSPAVVSPLPGTVALVAVPDGTRVRAGDAVVAVEAMKMEHVLRAGVDGVVRLRVAVGDQVARGGVVASIETDEDQDEEGTT